MRYALVSTWPAPNFLPFLGDLDARDDVTFVFTKPCSLTARQEAEVRLKRTIFVKDLGVRTLRSLAVRLRRSGCESVAVNGPSTRAYALLAPILVLQGLPVVMWTQEWLGPRVSIRRRIATPPLRWLSGLASIVVAQAARSATQIRTLGVPA